MYTTGTFLLLNIIENPAPAAAPKVYGSSLIPAPSGEIPDTVCSRCGTKTTMTLNGIPHKKLDKSIPSQGLSDIQCHGNMASTLVSRIETMRSQTKNKAQDAIARTSKAMVIAADHDSRSDVSNKTVDSRSEPASRSVAPRRSSLRKSLKPMVSERGGASSLVCGNSSGSATMKSTIAKTPRGRLVRVSYISNYSKSNRILEVKDPSPCSPLRDHTTKQWAQQRRECDSDAYKCTIQWYFLLRNHLISHEHCQ